MQAVTYLSRKVAQLAYRRILFEYYLAVAVCEYLQRVALSDTHCASYLLGDNNSAQIVDTSDYPCCFHIFGPPYFCCAILILCDRTKIM